MVRCPRRLPGRARRALPDHGQGQLGRHAQLAALPWRQVPVAHRTREQGHGRAERRTLKVTAVVAGLAFPHAAQAIQIARRRRPLTETNTKKWSTETVYATTSLTAIQASPAELAAIARGHWLIEDQLHWVRDVTWTGTRTAPRSAPATVPASWPTGNLAITILRLTGETNIAAGVRYHARRPSRPLQTIMNC